MRAEGKTEDAEDTDTLIIIATDKANICHSRYFFYIAFLYSS